LREIEGADGETRFGMLETIREFAFEQLSASGEADELRKQYAFYYLGQLEHLEQVIFSIQLETFQPVQREYVNMWATIQWLFEQDDLAAVARLAYSLYAFSSLIGYFSELRTMVEGALASLERGLQAGAEREPSQTNDAPIRASLLYLIGTF